MKSLICRFLDDRRGATAIEYALIAVLLAVSLIGGAATVGNTIGRTMGDVAVQLKNSQ